MKKANKEGKDLSVVALLLFILLTVSVFVVLFLFPQTKTLALDEALVLIRSGKIEKIEVIVNQNYARLYFKEPYSINERKKMWVGEVTFGSLELFEKNLFEENNKITENGGERIPIYYKIEKSWFWDFLWFGLLGLLIAFFFLGVRGRGLSIFNFGKAKAYVYEKGAGPECSFKDIAGLKEAKEELLEIIDFLKNKEKYLLLGAKIPKGVLLIGPPGTGKTLLAKAVAAEAGVPFLSVSGSEFVEMFVGVGASRVRDLFQQAKEKRPCIVFIDEIDAIGRMRSKVSLFSVNEERENTLNQLLTEMDGFKLNSGIIVIGATNRPDILDAALLRPGRFDRAIYIDLPDSSERKEIFEVHLKKIRVNYENIDLELFARQTPGLSGADIANICNEAALIAARKNKKMVDKEDIMEGIEKVVMGLEKKSRRLSTDEKKRVAIHESGHALVAYFTDKNMSIQKVSIIPRGRSLGAAWYAPEEKYIKSKSEMNNLIAIALAGRAAEEIMLGEISTGAVDDLQKATKIAYSMVALAGMDEKIGPISIFNPENDEVPMIGKPYSEEIAKLIDQRVREIIQECYEKAKNLLKEKKILLEKLSNLLFEKETIYKEDIEKIANESEEKKSPLLPFTNANNETISENKI